MIAPLKQAREALADAANVLGLNGCYEAADRARNAIAAIDAQAATVVAPSEFDHDIGADRFKVVKGAFWWHIRIGDGTANVGKFHSKLAAEDVALKMLTAFRDGAYMQHQRALAATPPAVQAPLTDEQIETMRREAADQGLTGVPPSRYLVRAVERHYGIGAAAQGGEHG